MGKKGKKNIETKEKETHKKKFRTEGRKMTRR
jgi:hypothetical protein